jgi:vacuolar-type H+-ATPase subunit E/Vma4
MALAELLRALREEAAGRRSEILATAEAEAQRIRGEARSEGARRHDAFVAEARHEEDELARRTLSRARAEASRTMFDARDRLLGLVLEEVERRASCADREPVYLDALPGEVASALDRLGDGPVTILVPASLATLVEQACASHEGVSVQVLDGLAPGFIARRTGEGMEMDGMLGSRLERAWPRLSVALLREAGP